MTDHLASVFLSYSWSDKPLARDLKAGLDAAGCRVWIDEGELRVGDSIVESVSAALDQVDFVVVLVSTASVGSDWCRKEVALAMTGEIARQGVTVLPLKVGAVIMPPTLKDKLHLAVDPADVPAAVEALLSSIRRHLDPPVPLPPRRHAPAARRQAGAPSAAGPHGPLHLVDVDREGITRPRDDGTPGSALYVVPLLLSGTPDTLWARLLVENWDRPPRFSTMHRPGIARVTGDRIVLDGTTVEEFARHHKRTLELVVAVTNTQYADHRRSEEAARQAAEERARRHRNEVDGALAGLVFHTPAAANDPRVLILRRVRQAEQDPGFGGVLSLDDLAEAAGIERHLTKAEVARLLDDGLIRTAGPPAEDLGGGYDLIQPTVTSAGLREIETR